MNESDHPHVVVVPPLAYAAAFVLGLAVEAFRRSSVGGPAVRFGLGGLLLVIGIAIMLAGVRAFLAAGTYVEVFRPATRLVTSGPYRFTRNPIYEGMTLAYLGAAMLADSLWALALVLPVLVVMHYGVVLREEEYLRMKFGDAYREYTHMVRRWV